MSAASAPDVDRYVSTGGLPAPSEVADLVRQAYDRHAGQRGGTVSTVYPSLAAADPDLFGIAVAGVDGQVASVGDARTEFTIMSVAKPFVFALVAQDLGVEDVRERVGVNATGLPFDSLAAAERDPAGRTNPMVNAGAIATTSLVPGDTADDKWHYVREGLSRFAGRDLQLDDEVYSSEMSSNRRNQGIAHLLDSYERMYFDPDAATDVYTRQCSLLVSATDLAVMGATLADGGVNPVTGERVVAASTCRRVLAVLATAGLYERSGDWLYDVGLPGKSGVSGGIVTIAPGKGAVGTFSPPLDAAGNSVRGQRLTRFVADGLALNLFASQPESERRAVGAAGQS